MFKSIFSKYLFTFTIILFVCIASILFVMTAMISDHSRTTQHEAMSITAGNTTKIVDLFLSRQDTGSADKDFFDRNNLVYLLDFMAANGDFEIYVFATNGVLAGSSDHAKLQSSGRLNATIVESLTSNNGEGYLVSDLGGFFEEKRLNSFCIGDRGFVTLVSTSNISGKAFTTSITNITITVALWVFLAAMISLYVISRSTTKPLSDITAVAKNCAKGRFDQRVQVVGYDEVAELGNAINNMAESLAHIDEVRNSFLGNVSHDLRTPMTTISGFVDGILDGTIPPEKHEYYLNIISQEVRRLSRLVNSLLELSRLESGTNLKMQDFNLSEKARTVLLSLESKINKKHIEIEFDTGENDVFVCADPDSIHQVIYNLMDNAIKFTQDGGDVSIKIGILTLGKKERKAFFAIKNTGQGIPPEELPHIFERFYKTDRSRGLDKSGTGLGLYIARTSVVNHGEDLTAESVPGEYTLFRFTLPVSSKQEKVNLR